MQRKVPDWNNKKKVHRRCRKSWHVVWQYATAAKPFQTQRENEWPCWQADKWNRKAEIVCLSVLQFGTEACKQYIKEVTIKFEKVFKNFSHNAHHRRTVHNPVDEQIEWQSDISNRWPLSGRLFSRALRPNQTLETQQVHETFECKHEQAHAIAT